MPPPHTSEQADQAVQADTSQSTGAEVGDLVGVAVGLFVGEVVGDLVAGLSMNTVRHFAMALLLLLSVQSYLKP